jgi:hypothetical protein
MSPAMMIMGVIVIILLYMYFFYKTGETKLGDKINLSSITPPTAIPVSDFPDPTARVYSYETWVYISKYDGIGKNLFYRNSASSGTKYNIAVSVEGAVPTLKVYYLSSTSAATSTAITVTDNFPIQSWAQVIVSVDSNYIDIYVNGKLTKSLKVTDIATPSSTEPITFVQWPEGTLGCTLANFVRRTNAIDPATAWSYYNSGAGSTNVSKYLGALGMDLSLKKDNVEYSKLNIF